MIVDCLEKDLDDSHPNPFLWQNNYKNAEIFLVYI